MPKKVTVLVRQRPIDSSTAAEALRLAVGQTVREHDVLVVLTGDGVYALSEWAPEAVGSASWARHLETLPALKGQVKAHRQDLSERKVKVSQRFKHVELVSAADISAVLASSQVVVVW